MTDLRENLGWIISSVIAGIGAFLSWFYESGLLSALVGIFIGAGIAYFVQTRTQKRVWKRENALTMRDRIYGPIFREISKLHEDVESVRRPDWNAIQKLEEIMNDYLFYRIEQDLMTKLHALLDRYEKYKLIYFAVERKMLEVIRNEVKEKYQIDIGQGLGSVVLRCEIEGMMIDSTHLEQTLLTKVKPTDFVERAKKEFGENVTIDVTIGGTKRDFSDFEKVREIVLHRLENEPLFLEELKQRKALLKGIGILVDRTEGFIELD